ncbi:hypothetical protein CHS0354_012767 [Potamilus streckersoni]|uniref:C1q domain-containing protein n=1 Tax=Potamilus streckersoni TaxID=2493646 RepID=A0AAE0RVT5_9BIVA|nr:hypothetical protein CHS0354_012767 [Potamilus streckersoni]
MKRIDAIEIKMKDMERLVNEAGQREKVMLGRIEYLETIRGQCEILTNEMMTGQKAMQREINHLRTEIHNQQDETRKLAVLFSARSSDDNKDLVGPDENMNANTEVKLNGTSNLGIKGIKPPCMDHKRIKPPCMVHKRASSVQVAFSAYISHRELHLGINQVIKYDALLINDGNHYNPHTGIFTCPEDGLYLFSFFTASNGSHKNWVRLVLDDVNISGATSEGTRDHHDDQGGNVAIFRLKAGQSVWTAIETRDDAELDADSDFRHVTFSGVRLGS